MTALIIRLAPVANAVEQHERIGDPAESRQAVVNRVLSDIRNGHHPYVPPIGDLARIADAGAEPAKAARS